jgi:hypothetical protein
MPSWSGLVRWRPSQLVPEADDLGEDARAAGAGVLELLQHERRGALADDEPVARDVERARRRSRIVVARRRREEHVEDGDVDRVELLGAPAIITVWRPSRIAS